MANSKGKNSRRAGAQRSREGILPEKQTRVLKKRRIISVSQASTTAHPVDSRLITTPGPGQRLKPDRLYGAAAIRSSGR